jgi:hypothetical protein
VNILLSNNQTNKIMDTRLSDAVLQLGNNSANLIALVRGFSLSRQQLHDAIRELEAIAENLEPQALDGCRSLIARRSREIRNESVNGGPLNTFTGLGDAFVEAAHNLEQYTVKVREAAPVGKQRTRQVGRAVRAANQVKKRRSAAKLSRKTKRKNRNK